MDWLHPYREEQVPPGGTITRDGPGKRIAKSITELQEMAVTDGELDLGDGLTGEIVVENNTMTIQIELTETGDTEGGGDFSLPDGGEAYMVLTLAVSSSGERSAYWDWVRAVDAP
jgi:hypothetical protein